MAALEHYGGVRCVVGAIAGLPERKMVLAAQQLRQLEEEPRRMMVVIRAPHGGLQAADFMTVKLAQVMRAGAAEIDGNPQAQSAGKGSAREKSGTSRQHATPLCARLTTSGALPVAPRCNSATSRTCTGSGAAPFDSRS